MNSDASLHCPAYSSCRIILSLSTVVFVLCVATYALGAANPQQPTTVIFDTDMESDVDDVGAVALLHALAAKGQAEILGMMVSSSNKWSAPCLDAINTYFGHPHLPIGVPTDTAPDRTSDYAQDVAEMLPHDLKASSQAPDATMLYRKLLASQPDHSVVIVSVGYLTNLASLLNSEPDALSPLNGRALVAKKVKRYVSVGGRFPRETDPGIYGNFKPAPQAAREVVEHWPTEIVFVAGGDFARQYQTGGQLDNDLPSSSPVRRAYEWFFERSSWADGPTHHSADLIAVLIAVQGVLPHFDLIEEGYNHLFENGTNEWRRTPDNEAQSYVTERTDPAQVTRRMDTLLGWDPNETGRHTGRKDSTRRDR